MANDIGSVLRCDLDGAILEILTDRLAMAGLFAVGQPLDRFVAETDRLPARAFLSTVREQGAVLACSLTIDMQGRRRRLQFDGGRVDKALLIFVRPADNDRYVTLVTEWDSGVNSNNPAQHRSSHAPPAAPPFSPREQEVVTMLLEGMQNRSISERLGIEESAVKARLRSIYRKLGVANRSQAIMAIIADNQIMAVAARATR
jgi:DNA-binding NarL/FixJ family response regulator